MKRLEAESERRGGWTHAKGGLKGGAPKIPRSEMMARLKDNAKKAEDEKKARLKKKPEEKARRSQPPSLPQCGQQ